MKWKTKQHDSEEQKMRCRTAYGFLYLNGAATRGIGWEEETCPTIMAWGGDCRHDKRRTRKWTM